MSLFFVDIAALITYYIKIQRYIKENLIMNKNQSRQGSGIGPAGIAMLFAAEIGVGYIGWHVSDRFNKTATSGNELNTAARCKDISRHMSSLLDRLCPADNPVSRNGNADLQAECNRDTADYKAVVQTYNRLECGR
jgi:hypothetical protein